MDETTIKDLEMMLRARVERGADHYSDRATLELIAEVRRLRQIEAQAATMRAALERAKTFLHSTADSGEDSPEATYKQILDALSGDAGKDYVHRSKVQKAHAVGWHAAMCTIKNYLSQIVEEMDGLK